MRPPRALLLAAGALLAAAYIAAACSAAPAVVPPTAAASPTPPGIPTLSPRAVTTTPQTAGLAPTAAAPVPSTAVPTPGETQAGQASLAPEAACSPDLCSYAGTLFLAPPAQAPANTAFDVTYRFGSTQSGMRDPHHGVEFLNPYGTPVLAAADGVVVVAGTDMDPTSPRGVWPITYYGPYSNFYGNLIVIEHPAPAVFPAPQQGLPLPVYTLYGHLSEIAVQVGQPVKTGQQIGKVGQAGIATGPHLHFEVRLGENTYAASRNPELWLLPGVDASGRARGAIAGRFLDSYQNSMEMPSIVIEHLPDGPQGPPGAQVTVMTYEEAGLAGQLPWQESFAVGDLAAGWYRLNFPMGGLRQEVIQVLPGQVTVVAFRK